MPTYNQLIHKFEKEFKAKGLYPHTVKALMYELTQEYNINLYLDLDNQIDQRVQDMFNEAIPRLLNEEPLAYVLGYSYFCGYKLIANKNVLIPRPETEELVGFILNKYDNVFTSSNIKLWDVATGSGAIAIAIKKEENNIETYGSDISLEAINVAKENAKNNEAMVKFFVGSWLEPLINNHIKVDILVANPPYIKQDEYVEKSVIEYEPHIALFGGADGLQYYREILKDVLKVLNKKALIFFEMGYDQKENLTNLVKSYISNCNIEVRKDINGKDRMMCVEIM